MAHFVIPDADLLSAINSSGIVEVNVSDFADTDYISLSLPDFPATKLDLTQTFIDFTSHETGDFGIGPTDQIAFSQADPTPPSVDGDTEIRFPISLLVNVDRSAITGVRFRLYANTDCTFRCLSIRACAAEWLYAPIDIDTLWNRVHRPPTPSGSVALRTNLATNPTGGVNPIFTGVALVSEVTRIPAASESIPEVSGQYITKSKYLGGADNNFGFIPLTFSSAGTYTISCFVWVPTSWNGSAPVIGLEGWIGSTILKQVGADLSKRDQWQRIYTTLSVVSGDLAGFPVIRAVTKPSTNRHIYLDALLIEKSDTLNSYFDGSYGGAQWSGTAHNSPSLLVSNFPVSNDIAWPSDFPILWKSDDLSQGSKDPRPIDISVSTSFTAGSLTLATGSDEDHFNVFAQYFRDVPTDDQIMLELNSITQADLDIKGKQPDFGRAGYITRDQENLNTFEQEDLEDDTQFDIERLPDYSEHTWLVVKLSWCKTAASNTLTILNADDEGYTFSGITLNPSLKGDLDRGEYILLTDLKGSTIRVRIYGLNQIGNIDESNLVFDSGLIDDDILIKRRKGRVGWWAQLVDGDASINDIRTRGLNFGEIITKELQSITPVKGVSLYAGTTSNKELLTEIQTAPWGTRTDIGLDPGASTTGKAYKITSSPQSALQGIASNQFLLDDPDDLNISFDIRFPSAGTDLPGGSLTAFLLGPYSQAIPINLSAFKKDVWSKVKVTLQGGLFQTGIYRLILLQTRPVVSATWWLENLSIQTSTVKWSARSYASDAWGSPEERWVSAGNTLNSLHGGIVFPEVGRGLQVRGQASRQEALISDFKAIPQYATLGRFAWDDEAGNDPGYEPTAFFSTTKNGQTVTVTGSGYDTDGTVTSYLWDFGDDHYDSGMSAVHTYDRAGTYTVTLIVSDDYGNLASYQSSVTVP